MYINLIHANGIWSTRHSGVPDLRDPAIVFVLGHYLAAPTVQTQKEENAVKITRKALNELLLDKFTTPADILECFVLRLPTLNRPVCSVGDKCKKFGLAVFGEAVPLQDLLADILQLSYADYHPIIIYWLKAKAALLLQVQNWLATRSLMLEDYVAHMLEEGWCNGLELWLYYVAANININIIQEDHTWSALYSGLNFADPIFILTDYGFAMPCLPEEDEALEESDMVVQNSQIDLGPDPWKTRGVQGGWPLGVS